MRWGTISAVIAALIVVAVLFLGRGDRPFGPPDMPASRSSDVFKTIGESGAPTESPSFVPPKTSSAEDVAATVRERNRENTERMKMFTTNGWHEVTIDDPPDEILASLSPALLGKQEEKLQMQIQSNTPTPELFDRLTEIALNTKNVKTRHVAIEALGRSTEKSAQLHLMELFDKLPDNASRSQILGYIIPQDPDDEMALFLQDQIASTEIPESMKQQAAFPLGIMGLLKTTNPDEAAEATSAYIPDEWRSRYSEILRRIAE